MGELAMSSGQTDSREEIMEEGRSTADLYTVIRVPPYAGEAMLLSCCRGAMPVVLCRNVGKWARWLPQSDPWTNFDCVTIAHRVNGLDGAPRSGKSKQRRRLRQDARSDGMDDDDGWFRSWAEARSLIIS
jgi:hypothetical protein